MQDGGEDQPPLLVGTGHHAGNDTDSDDSGFDSGSDSGDVTCITYRHLFFEDGTTNTTWNGTAPVWHDMSTHTNFVNISFIVSTGASQYPALVTFMVPATDADNNTVVVDGLPLHIDQLVVTVAAYDNTTMNITVVDAGSGSGEQIEYLAREVTLSLTGLELHTSVWVPQVQLTDDILLAVYLNGDPQDTTPIVIDLMVDEGEKVFDDMVVAVSAEDEEWCGELGDFDADVATDGHEGHDHDEDEEDGDRRW